MILLPTLMRGATGLEALPYQVAPGLSEVPKDFYPKLDLEGSKWPTCWTETAEATNWRRA